MKTSKITRNAEITYSQAMLIGEKSDAIKNHVKLNYPQFVIGRPGHSVPDTAVKKLRKFNDDKELQLILTNYESTKNSIYNSK